MWDLVVRPLDKDEHQSTRHVAEHLFVAAPYLYNAIVEALPAASLVFAVGIDLNEVTGLMSELMAKCSKCR